MSVVAPCAEDLEEALLFEFESEEVSGAGAAGAAAAVPPGLLSATASGASVTAAGSLPSVLSHGLRSVTKDASGTHVVAEGYVMHIEEVGHAGREAG